MPVETTHILYDEYAPQWTRCRDCVAGSDAVKAKGEVYLPPLDSHKRKSGYKDYLARALFYNAAGRTVEGLSGGIFQKTPAVEAPKDVIEDLLDVNLFGDDLPAFALRATKEALTVGRMGILVDMPPVEAGAVNEKPRPYWNLYTAEDIINWQFESVKGSRKLIMVVLREIFEEAGVDKDGKEDRFKLENKVRYRVLELKDQIYTQTLWNPVTADGKTTFVASTPITPVRRGMALNFIPFMLPWAVSSSPLLDLVDVNLSHYRGYADLKHGLHFTALPTPWISGKGTSSLTEKGPLSIGSGKVWNLGDDGQAGMLEFTGKGLGAIRTDLQDMQKMMASLGARLLEEAPHYAETTLSVSMRHSSDYATLRTIAQTVEQQLTSALQIHIWWKGTEEDRLKIKCSIELNKVFFDRSISAEELRALLLALQANTISYKTFYTRLSNTGWMREGISSDEELKDIEQQPEGIGMPPEQGTAKKGVLPSEKIK